MTRQGILLSLMASALFGVMYYYATLLTPLDGQEIFGWRIALTLPALTAWLLYHRDTAQLGALAGRVRRRPWLIAGLLASALLLAVQLWLFMWAPLQGRALPVSLGYFLLPLSLALAGRLVYKEKLSPLQTLAACCAALGVFHEIWRSGAFSWETLLVAAGYPCYFILRRALRTDSPAGLWCDLLLMLPLAAWLIAAGPHTPSAFGERPLLVLLIAALGVISATAVAAYMQASRLLPLGLFGLLGYLEPILLLAVSLLLGETIGRDEWLSYGPIWFAVLILMAEGVLHLRQGGRLARRAG